MVDQLANRVRARRLRGMAAVVALGLVVAACGGGSSKKTAASQESTTSTVATGDDSSSTTASTAVGETTTSTAAATGGATVTTARSTATTVRRTTATTTASKAVTQAPSGGLTNVTSAPTTAPSKDIQPGGTITWLKSSEQLGWDPVNISGAGSADGPQGFMLFDMLVYNDNGTVRPQTADSLTSADALVWTLKLKPNIKFSDGTPYDAEAVKFNYQRLQDPNNKASRAAQANLIASMDVLDPLTLRITLKAKNAVFPHAMVLIPFIGSPTAIQKQGSTNFNSNPVGAGPYLFKSWVRDSQMIVVRNPGYWQAPLPYVDQYIIKPIVDETQRNNTFCAGEANMVFVTIVGNADKLEKDRCGVSQPSFLNGGVVLYMNTTKAPMNDPRLRQAVALAIDTADYSKVVTGGLIPPMTSIFDKASPFYDAGIVQQSYNPTKAQQLFDQVAADNGGSVEIPISTFALTNYQNTALYVQNALQKFSKVKVTVTSAAAPAHVTSCTTRAYSGICVFANFFTDPEPGWTGGYTCNAGANPTGYCNPKFDAAVAENQSTLDAARRVAVIKDAQKLFYADVPAFFLEQRGTWTFTAPNIQDFAYVNDGLPMIDRLWIKSH